MSCFIKYLLYDLCIDIYICIRVSVYLYALQTPYVLFARMNGKINWSMLSLFISLAPIGEGFSSAAAWRALLEWFGNLCKSFEAHIHHNTNLQIYNSGKRLQSKTKRFTESLGTNPGNKLLHVFFGGMTSTTFWEKFKTRTYLGDIHQRPRWIYHVPSGCK